MIKKIVILGAGISGISAGRLLKEKGYAPMLYEKNDTIGGLIRCTRERGNLFHRIGGHVFNSKDDAVLKWFWSHFDKNREFKIAKRNAVVYIMGKYIRYPIEMNLKELGSQHVNNIINDLIKISHTNQKNRPSNFKEFLLNQFGPTLCSLYFFPYNEKIWTTNLEEISIDWLQGKLPMPDVLKILSANIIGTEEDGMVHSNFYYPNSGGSQFIADRLSEDLGIVRKEVESIRITDTGEISLNNSQEAFQALIFTGDIREIRKLIINEKIQTELPYELETLSSHGTSNMLCECDKNNYSWVYFPESRYASHRIIMTGNFSSDNNSKDIGLNRSTCTVEFSGHYSFDEISASLQSLPFNLVPIAYNYEPNSYIVNSNETRAIIEKTRNVLKTYNIYLCGRFAEWQYYNMDTAIKASMKLINEIT